MIKNKIIIITGGAGLIGSEITKKILDNEGKVVVIDVNKKKLINKFKEYSNKNLMLINENLCSKNGIDKCIKKVIKKYGKFDTLIHCAYPRSLGWGTKFENLKKKYLTQDLNNQLGLAILLSQKVLRFFKLQGHGNLIHLSSIHGSNAPKFEHYNGEKLISPIEYGAIKAGIISITKYLSKYYRNSNIRVNCISPGGIIDGQPLSFQKNYKKSCNDKGLLKPQDLVGTVMFLISEHSRYINGQNITIDDGWSL